MKKYQEIKNKIAENAAIIKTEGERLNGLTWTEKRDAEKGVKIAENIDALTLENAILNDNARRAYVAEVLPGVLEVWNKYAGKIYGPKTREKIRDEIKSTCGAGFYASSRYSGVYDEISLAPLGPDGYACGSRYDDFKLYTAYKATPFVDAENKIQKIDVDALTLSGCGEYVENVDERVQELRDRFADVRRVIAALDEKISAFNAVTPSRVEKFNTSISYRRGGRLI